MAGMGPPPKPDDQRRRRNASVAMTRLPAEGRPGKAPAWPLIPDVVMTARRDLARAKVDHLEFEAEELVAQDKPTSAVERKLDVAREKLAILEAQLREQRKLETALWADLWKLPQAVQWERLGWTRDVAQYVRYKVLAELGDLDSGKEARQYSDRLGLTPLAMLRLRWEVVANEVGAKREERTQQTSARRRLKVVDSAVAGS